MAVVVIVLGPFAANQVVTLLRACVIWQVMFGSGFRIGITIVTMEPQLMVQLGNHLQALTGFIAAAPGATSPGSCGQRFAATTRPASAPLALAFALPSRCARSLAPWILGPAPLLAGRQRSVGANGQQGRPELHICRMVPREIGFFAPPPCHCETVSLARIAR